MNPGPCLKRVASTGENHTLGPESSILRRRRLTLRTTCLVLSFVSPAEQGGVQCGDMKLQRIGMGGFLAVLLVATAMTCGCRLIGSIINTGISLLPVLLLISVDDGSGVKQVASLPLDAGKTWESEAAPVDRGKRDYRIEVRDVVQNSTGGEATIRVRYRNGAGDSATWERVLDLPLNAVVETNVYASLVLTCRVVEPPEQRGTVVNR